MFSVSSSRVSRLPNLTGHWWYIKKKSKEKPHHSVAMDLFLAFINDSKPLWDQINNRMGSLRVCGSFYLAVPHRPQHKPEVAGNPGPRRALAPAVLLDSEHHVHTKSSAEDWAGVH